MKARVPASSANLGPGFDTLAVALSLYVEVEVTPADELTVEAHGEGSDIAGDASHLAVRVASSVVGHDRLRICVRSDIPVARGLGSSAALAVAAAAAAGADDPLGIAARAEGHPENAAASVLGGLVTASTVSNHPVASRLPLDDGLTFVVLIPSRPLSTERARGALPAHVPHSDAAFNLGRMGMLVAGLADRRNLVHEATEDRLHQPHRASLFPEARHLMDGLVEAGALASCWSGAGPTVLGVVAREHGGRVRAAGVRLLSEIGLAGDARLLDADLKGLTLEG